MPLETDETLVGSVPLRDGVELRLIANNYRGRPFINLRVFERKVDGTWTHTVKGVTIPREHLPALRQLFEAMSRLPAPAR
jgi:hypothetical protein